MTRTSLANLGGGRPVALITGTNGKSTTTRMLAAALRTQYAVATNEGGDNMDAGIISALMAVAGRRMWCWNATNCTSPQLPTA